MCKGTSSYALKDNTATKNDGVIFLHIHNIAKVKKENYQKYIPYTSIFLE